MKFKTFKMRVLSGYLLVTFCTLATGFAAEVLAQGTSTGSGSSSGSGISGVGQGAGQSQSSSTPYDLQFIDMMIMHHQSGVDMAKLAEEKGENARVKAFAAKIRQDQEKDITELQQHRDHWYSGSPKAEGAVVAGMPMDEMMKKMQGMMSDLQTNSGHGFDHQFVDLMAAHHQDAIKMAKDSLTRAEHAEIKTMSRQTITKQGREVAELARIRAALKASHGHPSASGAKQNGQTGHTTHHHEK